MTQPKIRFASNYGMGNGKRIPTSEELKKAIALLEKFHSGFQDYHEKAEAALKICFPGKSEIA